MIWPMPIEHHFSDTAACAAHLAEELGADLRIAAPLGLGKPHALLNALYALTGADASRSMRLYTALSLTRPQPAEGFERRFLGAFLKRHFGADQIDPQYALDQAADALPANVEVHEFYLQSGGMVHSNSAQRSYISQNYTHVARDLVVQEINVLVQLVARREGPEGVSYSLSCNPDLTLDFMRQVELAGKQRPMCVAVVHPELPYMSGNAEVPEAYFDVELTPESSPKLFALPRLPIDLTEYALGLHASALVKDGGCLQIGIGALSDALVKALLMRQNENTTWRRALVALDPSGSTHALAGGLGGLAPFESGLYGASEMVMDGFMHLQRGGILKRRSWDNLALERASVAGRLNAATPGGHYLRGAFFLGSRELYDWLDETEAADPDAIDMCPVSNVNHLYGDHQALATLQRRDARFFNTCMMATGRRASVVVASKATSAGTTRKPRSRDTFATSMSPSTASPTFVARATANASRRCCRSATPASWMRCAPRPRPMASWRQILRYPKRGAGIVLVVCVKSSRRCNRKVCCRNFRLAVISPRSNSACFLR
jgi:acyl-CoA hydrolase